MSDTTNPFVGPRPFRREDAGRFFGRARETSELSSLIIAHSEVLLYSQSGAGKSSLLNAGILPALDRPGTQVFGPARVSGRLPLAHDQSAVRNVFTLNALLSVCPRETEPLALGGTTFTDFFGAPTAVAADGIEERILILDQFEEIFTTHQERWPDRAAFFADLGKALDIDQSLRVLFAIREEFIGRMAVYAASLPERLRTRFPLERLRETAALSAIERPVESTRRRFKPQAAKSLVKSLRRIPVRSEAGKTDLIVGEFVEPLHLQLACTRLWDRLPQDQVEIGEADVETHGDVDQALTSYYEGCLAEVVAGGRIGEGPLRKWFESVLITPLKTRGAAMKDDQSTAGLAEADVRILRDKYMIRAEERGGAHWYELTHDRFIAPILSSNREWFKRSDQGPVNGDILEARAKTWRAQGRPAVGLLSDRELNDTVGWLASDAGKYRGANDELSELLRASQQAAEGRKERRSRRLRQQRVGLTLLCLVAVLLGGVAWRSGQEAHNTVREKNGLLATYLSRQGDTAFEALAFGIQAIADDHPSTMVTLAHRIVDEVRAGVAGFFGADRRPSRSAVVAQAGFQKALAAVGGRKWYRSPCDVIGPTLSADGKFLAALSANTITVWNIASGNPVGHIDVGVANGRSSGCAPSPTIVSAFAISDGGDALCASRERRPPPGKSPSEGDVVCQEIGDRARFPGQLEIPFHAEAVFFITVQAAAAAAQRGVAEAAIEEIGFPAESIHFLPGGHRVMLTGKEGIRVVDVDSGMPHPRAVSTLRDEAHQTRLQPLAYSESRVLVATNLHGKGEPYLVMPRYSLWDIAHDPATLVGEPDLDIDPAGYLAFSPDAGTLVNVSSRAGRPSIRRWDARTGKQLPSAPVKDLVRIVAARVLDDNRLVVAFQPKASAPVGARNWTIQVKIFDKDLQVSEGGKVDVGERVNCNILADGTVSIGEISEGGGLSIQRVGARDSIPVAGPVGRVVPQGGNSPFFVLEVSKGGLQLLDLASSSVPPPAASPAEDPIGTACQLVRFQPECKKVESECALAWAASGRTDASLARHDCEALAASWSEPQKDPAPIEVAVGSEPISHRSGNRS